MCFDTLLQVLILKELWRNNSAARPSRAENGRYCRYVAHMMGGVAGYENTHGVAEERRD